MPASKAQQKAVSKYMKENYDVYQIRMPKGKKETIQNAAAACGQSVNAYINQAIDERMSRDSGGGTDSRADATQKPTERTDGGGVTPIPLDVETPSGAAQKAGQGA